MDECYYTYVKMCLKNASTGSTSVGYFFYGKMYDGGKKLQNLNELIGIIKGINFDGVIMIRRFCAFNYGLIKTEILHMTSGRWS